MDRLTGKTALVTGGAAGIGRAVVERFAEEGARVFATDINLDEVEALAETLNARFPGSVTGLGLDVASEASWTEVMSQLDAGLDIIVNNAGIGGFAPIRDCSLEFWRKVMSINLDGVFLGCRFAVEAMLNGTDSARTKGGASIINVSSGYGLVGRAGSPAYSASKGGVRLLTKALALEAGENGWNIRVNSVHPGFVETPLVTNAIKIRSDAGGNNAMNMDILAKMHPIGRVATPREIADAVLFLASAESSFMTGSEMVVDGGMTAA